MEKLIKEYNLKRDQLYKINIGIELLKKEFKQREFDRHTTINEINRLEALIAKEKSKGGK